MQTAPGLVLQGTSLADLAASGTLALTGYMSIDLYGTGTLSTGNLTLHTPDLRGPNGGSFVIDAAAVTLDNVSGQPGSGPIVPTQPLAGTLTVNAQTVTIGQGQMNVDQYANVALNASNGILFQNSGGTRDLRELDHHYPVDRGRKARQPDRIRRGRAGHRAHRRRHE
ncbi:MAG: hypothetical protein WDN28_33255 [Chthoniobacter sp.]